MGKLFWKFFFYLWLAQVTTMLGMSGYLWWHFQQQPQFREFQEGREGHMMSGRPAPQFLPPDQPPMPGNRHYRVLLPLTMGTLASVLFAGVLAWRFSRPIRSLRDGFRQAANGQLDTRTGTAMASRGDELSELGAEFDRMTAQLQQVLDNQRRLLHDVSHELRSPLARLQAIVGLLRQYPSSIDDLCERLERESIRMDTLLGELLTLSRLEARQTQLPQDPVDLGELITTLLEDNQPSAHQAGIRFCSTIPEHSACVQGDGELLYRAFDNLIRNALQHSHDEGQISIEVKTLEGGDAAIVEIMDQGPGVPAEELPQLFKPFFRASNNQGKQSGHGLGLALAQTVVQAHGGSITASNISPKGFRIRVELPCMPVAQKVS